MFEWNADGSDILYLTDSGKVMTVPVSIGSSLDPGPPRLLADQSSQKANIVDGSFDPVGMRWAVIRVVTGVSAPSTLSVVTGWFDELRAMQQGVKQ